MRVHAVRFFFSIRKDSWARVWRPSVKMCSCFTTGFTVHQKNTAARGVCTQTHRRTWTHTTHTSHADVKFTLSFFSFPLRSSWAWHSPWRCSITSTERGRNTMLSLGRRGRLMERSPTAWWDKTLNETSLPPFTHFTISLESPSLPRPSVQIQLCPCSLFCSHPSFCQRVTQLEEKGHGLFWQRRETHWLSLLLSTFLYIFFCLD